MSFPSKWGNGRTMCSLLCLGVNLFCVPSLPAQPVKSTRNRDLYANFSFLTGGQFQFFYPISGVMSVSFPYSITDASGVTGNSSFAGQKGGIYTRPSSYILPVKMELGLRRNFVNFSASQRIVQGRVLFGTQGEVGCGYLWFFGPSGGAGGLHRRGWVIKTSLNLNYTGENENGKRSVLGSIDNAGKTLHLLGQTANPTFTTHSKYRTTTHQASRLDISYSQGEYSLQPRIGFANNPYRRRVQLELELGYNLPLVDQPGIYLNQVATDGTTKGASDAILIRHSPIVASYDGRPIGPVPFRFGGFFFQCILTYGCHSK